MKLKLIFLQIFVFCAYACADVLCVGATIPPQQEPIIAVMGTNVNVKILMDGNQSPHFFRPSAKRLAEFVECDIYFTIGFPGEESVEKKFASIGNVKIVPMLDNISHHSHHNNHHNKNLCGEDIDTHYWTSPLKLKEMAKIVFYEACKLQPESAEYFEQNLNSYEKRCDLTMKEGRKALEAAGVTHILTYHPALGNYAATMGLTQLSIEKDGRAPTLGVVARVVAEARKHNIKKLFVQNTGEAEQSKVVLERLDATAITIPLLSSAPLKLIEEITAELVK